MTFEDATGLNEMMLGLYSVDQLRQAASLVDRRVLTLLTAKVTVNDREKVVTSLLDARGLVLDELARRGVSQ